MELQFKNFWIYCTILFAVACSVKQSPSDISSGKNKMFRSDALHLGVSDSRSFPNVKVKWKFETSGAVRGSAVADNAVIYIGSGDGFLYAINETSGSLKWKFETKGAIFSTPAIGNDKIIITSRDMNIYALDKNSGKLEWQVEDKGLPAHKWGWDYIVSSPTVVGNSVYVGSADGRILALDLNSGEEQWSFKTSGRVRATPSIKDDVLYIGSFDSYFYALDARSGQLKWKFATDGVKLNSDSSGWDRNSIDSTPAISDSLVVFGSRDGNLYALNTNTGTLKWKFTYGPTWSISSPAIHNGTVYTGWSDNYLFSAIDLQTGKEKWKYQCKYYVYSSPLVTDSIVYVGSHDRSIYAFNSQTGKKIWQLRTGGSVLSSPIIENDVMYIGSDDGSLYALERAETPAPLKAVYATSAPMYYLLDPRLAPYLASHGYDHIDTASIKQFINDRLGDKRKSVIVFVTDRVPSSLLNTSSTKGLLRQYLEAGGRAVWIGTIPNLYVFGSSGDIVGEDSRVAEETFGLKYDATHDWGSYYVKATDDGKRWPMSNWWIGSYSIPDQPGLTILARNEHGRPTSWLKNFSSKDSLSGFLQFRPWEVGKAARDSEMEQLRLVAEHGL